MWRWPTAISIAEDRRRRPMVGCQMLRQPLGCSTLYQIVRNHTVTKHPGVDLSLPIAFGELAVLIVDRLAGCGALGRGSRRWGSTRLARPPWHGEGSFPGNRTSH